MAKIIQTKNLSKSYGKTQVLKNIEMTIEEGYLIRQGVGLIA